ncbi:transporter substrate-binding domain-containing protein [soil metagenome]
MIKFASVVWSVVLACAALPSHAQDTLAKIKSSGVLAVGVKTDYKPWAYLDASGAIVGMEIDMANDLAKRLGVKLEMVPVTAANRMEFLNQGRIDLVLATMADKPDRRKVVGMIEPQYYASGGNVMAPKTAKLTSWEQLRGKKVCAIQGAYYNRVAAQHYGAELVVFPAIPDAKKALQGGNCVGFIFDSSLIESTLKEGSPEWAGYEMPLKTEDEEPWAMGVRLADLPGPWGQMLVATSKDWHKSGALLAYEKKWGIQVNPYLVDMQKKLAATP